MTAPTTNGKVAATKSALDEAAIRAKLESVKSELKIKGELIYPPPRFDLSTFKFDEIHTQGDKHPHAVTEQEARQFIEDAYFAIVRYNGNSYNYYGKNGASFVRMDLKTIRTAFKSVEYDDNIQPLMEVFEDE